jgi:DNA ligase-associated metallophosphoesterase
MTIEINGVEFELLYEKSLYRPDQELLIIADIHLGKAAHFRKHGVSIPAQAQAEDYVRLEALLKKVNPRTVYFLGDLFHSSINNDWHSFCDLIGRFPDINFILVKGNHDLINAKLFREMCIEVTDDIVDERFVYSHEPLDKVPANKVNIAGHIHPGYVLSGIGRQSMKLPCFYITAEQVILPAFGVLTGLYSMEKKASAKVYLVLADAVKRV